MKQIIYLAGQISYTDDRTYKWREGVENYFYETPEFEIINPCRNEFNDTSDTISRDLLSHSLFVPKDKTAVMNSTICIANLNHYDRSIPIIGTFFELAWYYSSPEKSVVGIKGDEVVNNHPFVRSAVDVWVDGVIDACNLIRRYYV